MHIVKYLHQIGENLTNQSLPEFTDHEDFIKWRHERKEIFHEMLGIDKYLSEKRTQINVKITGSIENKDFRIESLCFESLPGLFVTANLYTPLDLKESAPAILYVCGHAQKQKVFYQEHARKFAQLGFIVLILDTIQLGEVRGVHHGTYRQGYFNWISKGYTPAAVEVWNAIRGIDFLCSIDEVDHERLGMTGNSGGGAITWWAAGVDDRIKVIAPSCGTGTIESHIKDQTINGHCDCMFPNNPYQWSLIEMCSLVAPRPTLIVSPMQDKHFTIDSVRLVYQRLKEFYENLQYPDHISFMEFEGRHGYSPESRKAIFSWFVKHLMNQEKDIEDVDGKEEKEEDLLVFHGKPPKNDRSTSVHDWFIRRNTFRKINSEETLKQNQELLKKLLLDHSFSHFNQKHVNVDIDLKQFFLDKNNIWQQKFTFKTEKDISLQGAIQGIKNNNYKSENIIIHLRDRYENRENEIFQPYMHLNSAHLLARIDTRGTGATAWGDSLMWYIRRSLALTGRTISSLRIWDTLMGLKAIRSYLKTKQSMNQPKITLSGRGEMAIIALYAALMDGNISSLILEDIPETLDQWDHSEGTGKTLEIINALRFADLPEVASLLWPTRLIFIGKRPASYQFTEKTYQYLGEPGGTWRVKKLEFLNKQIL